MLGPNETMDAFLVGDLTSGVENNGGGAWSVEHSWTPYHCDPCTGPTLGNDVMLEMGYELTDTPWFTRLHVKYQSDITQDLMFYTTGLTEQSQSRYIQFNPDVADRFEFCDPETPFYPAYESICPKLEPEFARKSSMWPALPWVWLDFSGARHRCGPENAFIQRRISISMALNERRRSDRFGVAGSPLPCCIVWIKTFRPHLVRLDKLQRSFLCS